MKKNVNEPGVIYLATNRANGKYYIGQTIDFETRKRSHHKAMIKNNERISQGHPQSQISFVRAMTKHGFESFSWKILDVGDNKTELDNLEKLYIEMFQSRCPEIGYNLTHGGDGFSGGVVSDSTREKHRIAMRGNKNAKPSSRWTDEERSRVGEASKRMWENMDPETRKTMLERRSISMKGKVISDEQRKKQSISMKGRRLSEDQVRFISRAHSGKPWYHRTLDDGTIERRKIDRSSTDMNQLDIDGWIPGKGPNSKACPPRSEEHLRKISESLRLRRVNGIQDYHVGRRWMNDGIIQKSIAPDDVQTKLSEGWSFGYLKKR